MKKFHSIAFEYYLKEENIGRKPLLTTEESFDLDLWIKRQFFDGFDGTINELAGELVVEVCDDDTGYKTLDHMGWTDTGLIDLVDAIRNGWFTKSDTVVKA